MQSKSNRAVIKPYSKKELAILYKVSPRCFYTMIKPFDTLIGKKTGWYYNVKQVEIIFDKLGYPEIFLNDEYKSEKSAA